MQDRPVVIGIVPFASPAVVAAKIVVDIAYAAFTITADTLADEAQLVSGGGVVGRARRPR